MKNKEDWVEAFDTQFVKDCGDDIEPVFSDPIGSVGPVKHFIQSLIKQTIDECEAEAVGGVPEYDSKHFEPRDWDDCRIQTLTNIKAKFNNLRERI